MSNRVRLILAWLSCLSFTAHLSACSNISLSTPGPKNRHRTLLTDSVPLPVERPVNGHAGDSVHLSGQWQLGFQVDSRTLSSTINLSQNGNTFQGEGIDDQTKRHFRIEGGQLNGSQVSFFKRYDSNDMQPVEHKGQYSVLNEGNVHGPYMTGDFSTSYHGKILSGPWEAAMVAADKVVPLSALAASAPEPQPANSSFSADPGKAPHLSGKWNAGFESNFKTIHSVMYLEQEGGKLSGHGSDLDTKEKFFISKGWYHFPNVTIIRTYIKGKGAKASRSVTFKAQVSLVNDRDYQGPYLNGKTQGGGTWEAEMVK